MLTCHRHPTWRVPVLFITVFTVLSANLPATSISWRGNPAHLNYDLANLPLPNWSGGALVVLEGDITATPVFRLFDRQGQQMEMVPLFIPGARFIAVRGFSRGATGTIAACGAAFDGEGRGAPFLAIITQQQTHVVRTTPYQPSRVAVAADGTVWTVGIEPRELGTNEAKPTTMPVNANAAIIRHFSVSGALIGSFVPHSEITDAIFIADAYNFIRAGQKQVGWYCPRERRYIEITPDGSVSDIRDIILPSGAKSVNGMAITDSGDVLLSIYPGVSSVCVLNAASHSCELLQDSSGLGHLYGADGDVVMSSGKSRFDMTSFRIKK